VSGVPERIGLATWSGLPALFEDDQLLLAELDRQGFPAAPAVWDDPSIEWGEFDAVVLRSTWDYHRRYPEFLDWIDRCARATHLWNPPNIVRWNSHKSYLLELAGRGIPVIPTEIGHAGESLAELCHRRGWGNVVVKPAISANAEGCSLVTEDEHGEFEPRYREALARADQLVQPFVEGVLSPGERSLVYFNGHFSHAFQKGPALPKDLRKEAGLRNVHPSDPERSLADRTITRLDPKPLYARVDLVEGDHAEPWLMELELIEPLLYFASGPTVPGRFVDAFRERRRS
jgi:hypothetical protein